MTISASPASMNRSVQIAEIYSSMTTSRLKPPPTMLFTEYNSIQMPPYCSEYLSHQPRGVSEDGVRTRKPFLPGTRVIHQESGSILGRRFWTISVSDVRASRRLSPCIVLSQNCQKLE